MPDLTLDTSCDIPEDVIFRELEGEAVILNLETGVYFGLDEVGTRIWQLLVESPPLRDVHRQMLAEFDVAADVFERDLLIFAANLCAKRARSHSELMPAYVIADIELDSELPSAELVERAPDGSLYSIATRRASRYPAESTRCT